MLRLLLIPAFLIALLAGALAWSGGTASKRADFAFINRGDIFTLDLNQMSYMQDFRLTYGIREGLYGVDPKTYRPIPAGATGYDLSDDKRVWTFHLRKGAVWSNGDPVTAQDYIFSWRRMLEEPGEYTYLFYYMKNAEAYEKSYTKGEPLDFKTIGMEAPDPLTFRITLTDPVPYMLELVSFPPFYPRHERSMIKGAVTKQQFRDFADADVMDEFGKFSARKGVDLDRSTIGELLPTVREFAATKPFGDPVAQSAASATPGGGEEVIDPFGALPPANKLEAMAKYGFIRHTYRNQYTRPPDVVTNGPFNLTTWDFKRRLILTKDPNYWDAANVKAKSIEMVVNENPLSQFLTYEQGDVDWMADVPVDLAPELRAKGRGDLRTSPAFGTAFLTFLCRPNLPPNILDGAKNPLADIRVRQALAMSIDKKFISDNITRMGELPARTYLPPDGTLPDFRWKPGPYDQSGHGAYDDAQIRDLLVKPVSPVGPGLQYDVAIARKLLADAGYPNGQGFPHLPILYNTDSTARAKIVQVLKNQWKQNLNIDVDIQGMEGKVYKQKVSKKEYAIAPVAWYGDYPDASTFTDKYLSTSLQNDSDWQNKTFDDLCFKATKEPDAVKRTELLSQAENLIDTEVPIVPIYHYVNTSLSRDPVHGCEPNPRNMTIFKGVWVDRSGK